ncbi:MAG TPA: tRNA 4-thiouridine(8) synthase ThiI [Desulfobacteraceae bacterium]|nr:tRNA 4-thiouridine(8) synthase ThiI [Desulfobacteraceae bacterium]
MKSLCIFSGGLDSILAVELIRAQDIEVQALFFETPFFSSGKAIKSARSIHLPLRIVDITKLHLEMIKHPIHGYGGNMNPCIDCHTLMFRIAAGILEEERASFVFSGEVLGQRPMSQNIKALSLIASESGLGGLILRPLSARHLAPSIPENNGWIKRDLLLNFQGRSRKPQMELARKLHIGEYPTPAGGCLLTEEVFSRRLKDLFHFKSEQELREIELLKMGRHFRINSQAKIVVGRNKKENEDIHALFRDKDVILTSASLPGPIVLFLGNPSSEALELAAAITVSYSDAEEGNAADVKIIGITGVKIMMSEVRDKAEFRRYMI